MAASGLPGDPVHVNVDSSVGASPPSTLGHGRKTVAAAGTAEALAGSTPCKWVVVTALTINTQQVNVGGVGVLAASGSSTGVPLLPGDSIAIPVDNLNKVFVDSRVNTEGVSFLYGV